MVIEETLINFGFTKDKDNLRLKELLKRNIQLKELHIDIYPDNPLNTDSSYMLLLRMDEKNVTVESDGNRIILKKNDKCDTYISNILLSKIKECYYKILETYSEFIVNIQNIYYKITVFK